MEEPKSLHKTKKNDDTLILRFHLSIVVALNFVKTDVQTKKRNTGCVLNTAQVKKSLEATFMTMHSFRRYQGGLTP